MTNDRLKKKNNYWSRRTWIRIREIYCGKLVSYPIENQRQILSHQNSSTKDATGKTGKAGYFLVRNLLLVNYCVVVMVLLSVF